MNKKIATIIIIVFSMAIIIIGCSKESKLIKENNNISEPISKESALNVLKSEYGSMVITTIDDIREDGENYIVDVYIDPFVDEEDHNESQVHDHKESIGTHKINRYTGELTKPKNDN